MRRVCYITGTRADFGLMQSTLQLINAHPNLELGVLVTGMHLSSSHGNTVTEIVAAGLTIVARVGVDMSSADGAAMARNIGKMTSEFVDVLETFRPDIVLLLGDRGEMLAGALAAIHLNIPIAHIHGGERSGTVDEPVRHAISKLAHLHLVATADACERLVRMGENPSHVFVTGAPGLDGLKALGSIPRHALCESIDFDPGQKVALLVFHPVLAEAKSAGRQSLDLLEALLAINVQIVALKPNADAGSEFVLAALESLKNHSRIHISTHFPRDVFVSWMAAADLMVGNSSSGIIEAATFGTPVVNVGRRQNMRLRNANVIDMDSGSASVSEILRRAIDIPRSSAANVYGDGQAGVKITDILATVSLHADLLLKCNSY